VYVILHLYYALHNPLANRGDYPKSHVKYFFRGKWTNASAGRIFERTSKNKSLVVVQPLFFGKNFSERIHQVIISHDGAM
jgi:hypothetical protein